jgi:acetyl esterase/lipase
MVRRVVWPVCAIVGLVAGLAAVPTADTAGQEKKAQPKLPEGVKLVADVEYGPHGERNRLDVYVPPGDGPFPLVIWVHGGGWQNGSKAGGGPAVRLLNNGYATASINYRLSGQATFPAQIEDCKAAVRFLRANAKQYKLNPDRFGVWGSSAGGHLVALLGTAGDVKEFEGDGRNPGVSSRVQAVCDFYGPTDLLQMGKMSKANSKIDHDAPTSPEAKLIGGPLQSNKEKADRANPVKYVTKDDPPFLIVHGDADPLVPDGQSKLLHDALQKAGVESTLIVIPGAGHGGAQFGDAERIGKITAFFDKHLKMK